VARTDNARQPLHRMEFNGRERATSAGRRIPRVVPQLIYGAMTTRHPSVEGARQLPGEEPNSVAAVLPTSYAAGLEPSGDT
jgi:hypothetical protein